jgi:hypothetical protein
MFISQEAREALPHMVAAVERLVRFRQADADVVAGLHRSADGDTLLSAVPVQRLQRILKTMLDPEAFLSDHGIRSLSRWHREHPLQVAIEGQVRVLDYEPAESTTPLFGGNSNWRGPVWFPVNYLLIRALRRLDAGLGDSVLVEHPTGSGRKVRLGAVADDLSDRLVALFRRRPDGTRPCFGGVARLQHDPAWNEHLLFFEYFHGDDGAGLGAMHQTGWTALVASLICERGAG